MANSPSTAVQDIPLTGDISGFPEYLPVQQRGFNLIVERMRSVCEGFGFTPLMTASVERIETLMAKGIAAKEVYGLRRLAAEEGEDGSKDIALRFDQTVPLARYMVQNQHNLVFPYRAYQVQPVWRGDRPQRGRYRQFHQFDLDILGDEKLPFAADAEIVAAGIQVLRAAGFKDEQFTVRVNNRKLLSGLLMWAGFAEDMVTRGIKIIDDVEKAGWEKTMVLLREAVPGPGKVEALAALIQREEPLAALKGMELNALAQEGFDELRMVIDLARTMAGLTSKSPTLVADLTIARGLDYYTGTVLETRLHPEPGLGSIMSGGRYDNLAASLGKKKLPGVGIGIGISRFAFWLLGQPEYAEMAAGPASILVACQDEKLVAHYAQVAQQLRSTGLRVEQSYGGQNLGTQLKNAAKRGVAYAVIIGESERAGGMAVVKNLATGEQRACALGELAGALG